MTKRIFITNVEKRKSIPIIRSLGRKNLIITGGSDEKFAPGFYSKYCKDKLTYPSIENSPEEFLEWLKHHLDKYEILFPVDEDALDIIVKHKSDLLKLTKIPVPDYEVYIKARNKAKTIEYARKIGIYTPKTYILNTITDLYNLSEKIIFPAVIKPRTSSGSRGIVYVNSKSQLLTQYKIVNKTYKLPLLQEFIPPGGAAIGVEILMDKKREVKALCMHRRLREYPINGGPSTLRETIYIKEIADMAIELLKDMEWYGIAMVEFKVDPRDNKAKLMEINPKFWGSIALPIAAGIDFPWLLYLLEKGENFKPVLDYKLHLESRWLFPGDILNFMTNLTRGKIIWRFFDFKNQKIDIIDKNDLKPLLGLVQFYSSKIFNLNFLRKNILRK